MPFTIVRSTQFFEFLGAVVEATADGEEIGCRRRGSSSSPPRTPPAPWPTSPTARPLNDTLEVAGPDPFRLDDLTRRLPGRQGRRPAVIADPHALYFGSTLTDETLIAGAVPRFGHTEFDSWLQALQRGRPLAPSPGRPAMTDASPATQNQLRAQFPDLPQSPLITRAFDHARERCPAFLFNHVASLVDVRRQAGRAGEGDPRRRGSWRCRPCCTTWA